MSGSIKVLLFDLGNVLVDFDYRISVERIARFCPRRPEDIINFFLNSEITASFEAGKISPEDFFTGVKEALGLKLSYEAFVPIWNEVFFLSAKNRHAFSLVNNLRERYKTAMISNINILHYEYLRKHFPVFGPFSRIFLSYELGLVKPDPLIYQRALGALNALPEEVFYTDDRPELVESAGKLGMRAFVFKGAKQLQADLSELGIIF